MDDSAEKHPARKPDSLMDRGPQRTVADAPAPQQASTKLAATPVRQLANIELPEGVVRRLRERFGASYECWFGKVKVMAVDNKRGILTLSAPSNFERDWMQSRYEFYVIDAWNAARHTIGGPHVTRVEFRTVRS